MILCSVKNVWLPKKPFEVIAVMEKMLEENETELEARVEEKRKQLGLLDDGGLEERGKGCKKGKPEG